MKEETNSKSPIDEPHVPQSIQTNPRDERNIPEYIPTSRPLWIAEFEQSYNVIINEGINSNLFSSPIPKTPGEGCNSVDEIRAREKRKYNYIFKGFKIKKNNK